MDDLVADAQIHEYSLKPCGTRHSSLFPTISCRCYRTIQKRLPPVKNPAKNRFFPHKIAKFVGLKLKN